MLQDISQVPKFIFDELIHLFGSDEPEEEFVLGDSTIKFRSLDKAGPYYVGYRESLGGKFRPTVFIWTCRPPMNEIDDSRTVAVLSLIQHHTGSWAINWGEKIQAKLVLQFPMFRQYPGIDLQSSHALIALAVFQLALIQAVELPLPFPYWQNVSTAVDRIGI